MLAVIALILGVSLLLTGYIWGIIESLKAGSVPIRLAILFPVIAPGILAFQKRILWAPTGLALNGILLMLVSPSLLATEVPLFYLLLSTCNAESISELEALNLGIVAIISGLSLFFVGSACYLAGRTLNPFVKFDQSSDRVGHAAQRVVSDFADTAFVLQSQTPKEFIMQTKISMGHKIGAAGASLALICFFLPWIVLSYFLYDATLAALSGWQLASGLTNATIGGGGDWRILPGQPILFVVPLVAIGALVAAFLAWQRTFLNKLTDGFGLIAGGALSLVVVLIVLNSSLNSPIQGAGLGALRFDTSLGLFGVALGNLAIIAGGVLNLRSSPSEMRVQAPTSPPSRETSI